jgi:hypothetical protein
MPQYFYPRLCFGLLGFRDIPVPSAGANWYAAILLQGLSGISASTSFVRRLSDSCQPR